MDHQTTIERNRKGFAENPYRLMPENRPEGCPRPKDIIKTLRKLRADEGASVLWEVQMVYVRDDGHIMLRCREYEPQFEAWARILDYTGPETSIEIVKTWEHRIAEKLMGESQ